MFNAVGEPDLLVLLNNVLDYEPGSFTLLSVEPVQSDWLARLVSELFDFVPALLESEFPHRWMRLI